MRPHSFKELSRQIIVEIFPEAIEVFDLEADEIIEGLYSGRRSFEAETPELVNSLGEPILESLGHLAVLLGLFLTLEKTFAVFLPDEDDGSDETPPAAPSLPAEELETRDLAEIWLAELVGAGLDEETARAIVERFVDDLSNRLKNGN